MAFKVTLKPLTYKMEQYTSVLLHRKYRLLQTEVIS